MTESDSTARTVSEGDAVALTVPADAAYVSVLRTVTASLAARRDFTIEEIDDLRIAVDEASSLLLPHAGPGSQLAASFAGSPDELAVQVRIVRAADDPPTADAEPAEIDETSFAWMVLAALADTVTSDDDDDTLRITLTKARGARAL